MCNWDQQGNFGDSLAKLPHPWVSVRAWIVGRPGWEELQHPLTCLWDGFGNEPDCARLQHPLLLTGARIDVG